MPEQVELRRFTDLGMESFRKEIKNIKSGNILKISNELLYSNEYSELIQTEVRISDRIFIDKYDAALYLNGVLENSGIQNPFSDKELWSWLAAFYFDQLCKRDAKGKLNPGEESRYILRDEWKKRYRHLLAIPVIMYKSHGDAATLFLNGPLNNFSDIEEQFLSRLKICTNTNVICAAKLLYWDEENKTIKRGISQTEHKAGTVRRFVSVIEQLDLTYDLANMKPEEIIEILPSEFSKYK